MGFWGLVDQMPMVLLVGSLARKLAKGGGKQRLTTVGRWEKWSEKCVQRYPTIRDETQLIGKKKIHQRTVGPLGYSFRVASLSALDTMLREGKERDKSE